MYIRYRYICICRFSATVILMTIWLLGFAAMFANVEGWTYRESVYFGLVTLSTVGIVCFPLWTCLFTGYNSLLYASADRYIVCVCIGSFRLRRLLPGYAAWGNHQSMVLYGGAGACGHVLLAARRRSNLMFYMPLPLCFSASLFYWR